MRIHESAEGRRFEVPHTKETVEDFPRQHSRENLSSAPGHDESRPWLQSVAENACNETRGHMLDEHGNKMSEAQKESLEYSNSSETLKVLSVEEYTRQFPETGPLVMGHCDANGNIYIKAVSENAVSHISTHETIHQCANRESRVNERGNLYIKSGLRETEVNLDRVIVSDSGRGINEGTTQMYTLRELKRRGEERAVHSLEAYSLSREWAERLEQLVGPDKLSGGYFGEQKPALEHEFNRLDKDTPNAWETFSRNIDILEYSSDEQEVYQAQRELTEQYVRMLLEKDLTEDKP